MLEFAVTLEHPAVEAADPRWQSAAELILGEAGCETASISLAVVDDLAIHELNRRYLQHDYPTDVLSFLLEEGDGRLEGEVIVSADTAARQAVAYGWPAEDELLLYVVHGLLHLCGHDDQHPRDIARMRAAEARVLATFGLAPPRELPPANEPSAKAGGS